MKKYKLILKYLKKYRFRIIIAFTLTFMGSLLSLTYGYFNGRAVEEITNMNLNLSINYLIICFLVTFISITIFDTLGNYITSKTKLKIINDINLDTYYKVLNLEAFTFEEKTSGEIINRVTSDANIITDSISNLIYTIMRFFGSILIFIYVCLNSYIVAIELIIVVILLYIVMKYFNPKIKKVNKEVKKVNDIYTSNVSETVRGIREIKTLGIKDNLFSDITKNIKKLFDKQKEELSLETRYEIINGILRNLLEIVVFITSVILLYYGKVSMTFFIAMTYYVYRYSYLIESLANFSKTFQKTKVAIERINEILDDNIYKEEKFGSKEINNPKVLEFKNVTFKYKNDLNNTLNNFNIKLETNKKIAIVGASGQGKTTLFNLITRIFNVDKGEILIDGVNIKDLTEDNLRKNISIIRQEPFIFNKTIKENFKIVNSKIKLDEIKECTKKAYIDTYIESLKNKYDTLIGEGGVNLSGGQKQRLAIARALSKKSSIILFDEATSSLDNESQKYIKKSIDNLVKDHMVIIIAHRLSTIIDADIIYLIDKGKVVDYGTHNELIKRSEYYKKLYNSEEC